MEGWQIGVSGRCVERAWKIKYKEFGKSGYMGFWGLGSAGLDGGMANWRLWQVCEGGRDR